MEMLNKIPNVAWIFVGLVLIYLFLQTNVSSKETFVASNNEDYVTGIPKALARDDDFMNQLYQSIVEDDKNKFQGEEFKDFRKTTHFEGEVDGIISYVLRRINLKGNHGYAKLDLVSAEKQVTISPKTNEFVNRFNVTLFIQEKNKLNVHAHGSMITFIATQIGGEVKIEKLHTVTDYFYQDTGPYEGYNRYTNFYRLENQFHLNAPWKTNEQQTLLDEGKIESLLEQWHKSMKNPQYKCFSKKGDTSPVTGKGFYEDQGSRWDTRIACEQNQGVWDKPIENDAECPFYKKNLNYPNRLGGKQLHSDKCEMPIGTKTIGYRYLSNDPIHQPMCYNCKIGADGMPGSIGYCCTEQLDRSKYSNLASPDYAYPDDTLLRMQFSRELAERGLNWSKHPTTIRNVLDPNQKQPVFNAIIGPGPGPETLA